MIRLPVPLFIALIFLAIIAGGGWAYGVSNYRVFPHDQIVSFRAALEGVPGDDRPFWTRMTGDVLFRKDQFAANRDVPPLLDETEFRPVRVAPDAPRLLPEIEGIRIANPGGVRRYFVVYGSFTFPDLEENLGAIAIDSTGTVYRAWPSGERGGQFTGPHIGLAVSDDGILATNARGVLTGQSWCGETLWQSPREDREDYALLDPNGIENPDWHHDVVYFAGSFYTFVGQRIARVDAVSGAITEEIDLVEVMQWSWQQGLSLMDMRAEIFNPERERPEEALDGDPFHSNKVDILGVDRAAAFPMFEPGDMLLSLRNLNMVAVIRPGEKRILWWRIGLTSRQHDATFGEDGGIEVFNNAPFTRSPAIRRLSVETDSFEDIFDLTIWELVMDRKGNFERQGERLLVVDDGNGRMISGLLDGSIDTVLENRVLLDGVPRALQLRNATEIPAQRFASFEASCRE